MNPPLIKVTSPSFSKNPVLQKELAARQFRTVLNAEGRLLSGEALAEYIGDADGVILGLEKVDDSILEKCPRLRIISKYGVGLDNIDADACKRRGIAIGWTPGVNRRSVAELALGVMLWMAHNIFQTQQQLKQGKWHKDGGVQISGKTVGIIGLGNIGKELAQILKVFNCRILGNDVVDVSAFAREHGVELVSKEEIFRNSDFVTLHVPINAETKHLINDRTLAMFKSTAFLINTSRGSVVDQDALKRALQAKKIAGAGLDVYEVEPPTDLEFLQLPNLVCTPHISGNSFEAVVAMGQSAIKHLDVFFKTAGYSVGNG